MTQAGAAAQPFLSLRGLTKRFGDVRAVDRLDLDVVKGELVAFLGPSGCGKTTSLRMIAGLSPASEGSIHVDGRDLTGVPAHRRDMGVVFQSYALFPHLTVARNVAFGLEMRGVERAEIGRRVEEAIALVRLTGLGDRKPAQMSGGQQQRVALARALVIRPSILLLDEPLSNLDAKLRDEMRAEIRDIQQRLGITAIFVTHDQVEALTMCDRVAVMNAGKLEQLGSPQDLYERPASAFVAAFVGRTNRFRATADGEALAMGETRLRAPAAHRGPVEVMVRPHRMALREASATVGADENRLVGVVKRAVFAGDVLHYEVDVGGVTA
ncbi:MAG: ABC transporter ATP-binding protein, partial [Methylobacteriaceae bacterium]|nr:ABC transporter ATP-binding protein [Methylobacteriaceae bacterium]